jgi:hypothetical protein
VLNGALLMPSADNCGKYLIIRDNSGKPNFLQNTTVEVTFSKVLNLLPKRVKTFPAVY